MDANVGLKILLLKSFNYSLTHTHNEFHSQVFAIFFLITIVNAQIRPILQSRDRDAVILKQIYEPNPDGSYVYRYTFP